MIKLHTDELTHIAHLAKLKISDDQMKAIGDKLNNILGMIAQMNEVNTNHIEPLSHPIEGTQTLREDRVTEVDQHVAFQKIAPLAKHDLYLVPQVIETEK